MRSSSYLEIIRQARVKVHVPPADGFNFLLMKSYWIPILVFAIFIVGLSVIQFGTPNLPDNDGFYHIKMAYLMRTESLRLEFIWLPLSILNSHEFADHHFLFHVLLMPFTYGDLRIGAKLATVLFAGVAFFCIWWLLQRQKIPYAFLWALALLGVSDAFLYRMSMTRAQSLSLAILMLAVMLLLENKPKRLAVLSFFYVWMYDAFPLILIFGVLYCIAVYISERRFEVVPLSYIFAGIVMGMILNPYFPSNIVFAFRHLLPKLTEAGSVSVGNEWYPYDTKTLLANSWPALGAFASGIFALGLSPRKMDLRTTFALLLAVLFGIMLLDARRFVEYFPAFALIFAAFATAPLLDTQPASVSEVFSTPWQFAPLILLSVAIVVSIAVSVPRAREAVASSKPYDLYAGASAWLMANTPAGSRVFQTDWDDFPRLFFYNTHNTYLIGLDPTYMQLYNPELYGLWVAITEGQVSDPSTLIAQRFDSQYVHTDLSHEDFLLIARQDSGLKEVFHDKDSVVFKVIP